MYFVMYTMIDTGADLYNNLNNLYVTLMMVTSMALLMLWMMPSMFPDRRTNAEARGLGPAFNDEGWWS
jgi:hypothetical protein